MDKAVIYIHGKGGNAEEAIHYKPLFRNCDVIGLDYTMQEKILLYGKSQRTFCMVKKIILPLMERYLNLYRGLIQPFLL